MSAIGELAQYIFNLGRQTEQLKGEVKGLVNQAYDVGYQRGRQDVEDELGLDPRAVLLGRKVPGTDGAGGTGAPSAPN
jgi:hypothetical protein